MKYAAQVKYPEGVGTKWFNTREEAEAYVENILSNSFKSQVLDARVVQDKDQNQHKKKW